MRRGAMRCLAIMGVGCIIGWLSGCVTTSHKTVRTYEYSDEPPTPVMEEASEGEYQMQSPGEMVGPGEMVPPTDTDDDS